MKKTYLLFPDVRKGRVGAEKASEIRRPKSPEKNKRIKTQKNAKFEKQKAEQKSRSALKMC